jgi:hypothetical protein
VYSLGTLFVPEIYVQIPCIKEIIMMMMMIIIIAITIPKTNYCPKVLGKQRINYST